LKNLLPKEIDDHENAISLLHAAKGLRRFHYDIWEEFQARFSPFLESVTQEGSELEEVWITFRRHWNGLERLTEVWSTESQLAEFQPIVDKFWRERLETRRAKDLKGPDPFRKLTLEFRAVTPQFTLHSTLEEREAPRMNGDEIVGVAW
jgi:hypothetical protein